MKADDMNHILFRACRKIIRENPYTSQYVNYKGQQANDYISNCLEYNPAGLMVSKFGTIELDNLICFELSQKGIKAQNYIQALKGRYSIHMDEAFTKLCNNAGFFPPDKDLLEKYYNLVCQDVQEIDILGSYLKSEEFVQDKLSPQCVKVDLDGYYAPFLWKNPWTKHLKDKRVLVVHPFVESIKSQYDRREKLFEDPDVLPEFSELYLVKAVQSIAGNGAQLPYRDWFEALQWMKEQMDQYPYDIALIGCGAYGMDLAAHAKRKGKAAIHLAGWTQMLFGIYGNRWIKDQPEYGKFINEFWVRPNDAEKPKNASHVENACYW